MRAAILKTKNFIGLHTPVSIKINWTLTAILWALQQIN